MERNHAFLNFLQLKFTERNQLIGNYLFVKWMANGNFQYEINEHQRKSISSKLLILAFEKYQISKISQIDYQWVKSQGHDNWCTPLVLRILIKMYDEYLIEKNHE